MNKKRWMSGCIVALMAAGLSGVVMAQEMSGASRVRPARGTTGFISTLEQKVGLTPEQRDSVRGLLADQRQKTQAMREETDSKIRALLTPEQQKKFDDVLAAQKARRFQKNKGE